MPATPVRRRRGRAGGDRPAARVPGAARAAEVAEATAFAALGVAPQFGLSAQQAKDIAREVGRAVLGWREEAAQHGLTRREIDRMASAFEHDDLKLAVK